MISSCATKPSATPEQPDSIIGETLCIIDSQLSINNGQVSALTPVSASLKLTNIGQKTGTLSILYDWKDYSTAFTVDDIAVEENNGILSISGSTEKATIIVGDETFKNCKLSVQGKISTSNGQLSTEGVGLSSEISGQAINLVISKMSQTPEDYPICPEPVLVEWVKLGTDYFTNNSDECITLKIAGLDDSAEYSIAPGETQALPYLLEGESLCVRDGMASVILKDGSETEIIPRVLIDVIDDNPIYNDYYPFEKESVREDAVIDGWWMYHYLDDYHYSFPAGK